MKKISLLLVLVLVIFGLAGCAGSTEADPSDSEVVDASVETKTTDDGIDANKGDVDDGQESGGAATGGAVTDGKTGTPTGNENGGQGEQAGQTAANSNIHHAEIAIENYGTITVELDGNAAPETVANFISLAQNGFYNGLTFHRIMEGFMMQGGDPNGNGTGGSSQTITGEFAANGIENNISHKRGAISMARAMDYNSASSQFFIVHEDSTFLDGAYAAFGHVTSGMDIVDTICESAEPIDDNGLIAADKQPKITSITIID